MPPKSNRKTGGNRPHKETLLLGKVQQETSVNLLLLHHLLFGTEVSRETSQESLPQVLCLELQVFFLFQRNNGQTESVRQWVGMCKLIYCIYPIWGDFFYKLFCKNLIKVFLFHNDFVLCRVSLTRVSLTGLSL